MARQRAGTSIRTSQVQIIMHINAQSCHYWTIVLPTNKSRLASDVIMTNHLLIVRNCEWLVIFLRNNCTERPAAWSATDGLVFDILVTVMTDFIIKFIMCATNVIEEGIQIDMSVNMTWLDRQINNELISQVPIIPINYSAWSALILREKRAYFVEGIKSIKNIKNMYQSVVGFSKAWAPIVMTLPQNSFMTYFMKTVRIKLTHISKYQC